MKLLIIDPNISLGSPSMKGVVRSLPALRAAGFEIELWCWDCDEGLPAGRVVKLPRLGKMRVLYGHAFGWLARLRAWWIYEVRKQQRPDVIYTVAWYLPQCDVCHVHFSPWDWERRQQDMGVHSLRDVFERIVNWLGLITANRFLHKTTARRIITVSDAVAEDLREAAPELQSRLRVLPNSYDAARFHPGVRTQWRDAMRAKLNFSGADCVFIFVSAGHYRRKGFFLAVEAVAKLRGSHPHAKFLVIGGAPVRLHGLQSQLNRSHPDWRGWIIFTGNVPEVEKYFAAADALFFPSYSEAFALVEAEAAACGLPLFLTRHHGSEMILEDGINGRYVEFDAAQIAGVLSEFVTGVWQPRASEQSRALDGDAYAQRLIGELGMAEAASSPPSHLFAEAETLLTSRP